jgi:hypothetical protein
VRSYYVLINHVLLPHQLAVECSTSSADPCGGPRSAAAASGISIAEHVIACFGKLGAQMPTTIVRLGFVRSWGKKKGEGGQHQLTPQKPIDMQ